MTRKLTPVICMLLSIGVAAHTLWVMQINRWDIALHNPHLITIDKQMVSTLDRDTLEKLAVEISNKYQSAQLLWLDVHARYQIVVYILLFMLLINTVALAAFTLTRISTGGNNAPPIGEKH